jgi:hypothetical protein
MSRSLSNLLAAGLIAAAFAGTIPLLKQTVPSAERKPTVLSAEAAGRLDPSRRASPRGVPWASSLDLMFEVPEAEKGLDPITP